MAVIISVSDMQFGEYDENQVFQVETCRQYTEKLKPNGIKSCEFILRRKDKLYFVEAKTTCPRQLSADSPAEKIKKYHAYIHDIALKMRHSLMLYANILLERYQIEDVPKQLAEKDLSCLEIRLVLVVKNAEKEWLIPFQDVFKRELREELRIWKIPGFSIINEETAREKHFIL